MRKFGVSDQIDAGKRFVSTHKERSVKEWVSGIAAGTLEKTIGLYYDNIKQFDDKFEVKDIRGMSRIELLIEQSRVKDFINANKDIGNGNNAEGEPE